MPDTTQKATDDGLIEASRALKKLIQLLSKTGMSHATLAARLDRRHQWNKNAIKQFVARDGAMRETEKNIALANEVYFQVIHRVPEESRTEETKALLQLAYRFVGDTEHESQFLAQNLTTKIGNRFQTLRRDGAKFQLPETLAFARLDWKGEQIIVLLVQSKVSDKGRSFTMKIEGRRKNRRIIVGDVLYTMTNIYFSGLAYDIHSSSSSQKFFSANAFDFDSLSDMVDPNEIGLECFAISINAVRREEIPVAFHGLDGRGNPTSGVGLVIRPEKFAHYGISESRFTSIFTRDSNAVLADALVEVNAVTVSPRMYDDEGNPVLSG